MPALAQDKPLSENMTLASNLNAAKQLVNADALLADQKWPAAIAALQSLLETRAGDLVPQVAPGPGEAQLAPELATQTYLNLGRACRTRLFRLPASARATYRQRYDSAAERWFAAWESTGDAAMLDRIARLAPLSSRGDEALLALGELAWDRADFVSAAQYWSMLLAKPANSAPGRAPNALDQADRYPDPDCVSPAEAAARVVLCRMQAPQTLLPQREPELRGELIRFDAAYGQTVGTLAGQSGPLGSLLQQYLEARLAEVSPVSLTPVLTVGGDATRAGGADPLDDIGAMQWQASVQASHQHALAQPRLALLNSRRGLPSMHLVTDGEYVFGCDQSHVYARNLLTGAPAWGTTGVIYPPYAEQRIVAPSRPFQGLPAYTCTLEGRLLYARLGSAVTGPARDELRDLETEVVCLDLEKQGQLLWRLAGSEIADDGGGWSIEGSPVVVDGRAYLIIARRRTQLELRALCVHALTGETLWNRPLGAARASVPDALNRTSHLMWTLGGDHLFLSTDLGAVFAIDLQSGQTLWATMYEQDSEMRGNGRLQPAIYADGRVFVAPNDAARGLCLDARTGEVLWTFDWGRLVGIAPTLSGPALISMTNTVQAWQVSDGHEVWSISFDGPGHGPYGRGVIAGDLLYYTWHDTLLVINARRGEVIRQVPLETPIIPTGGGNLLIAGGMLVIADDHTWTGLSAYSRWLERVEERVELAPSDGSAALLAMRLYLIDDRLDQAYTAWLAAQRAARTPAQVHHVEQEWRLRAIEQLVGLLGTGERHQATRVVERWLKLARPGLERLLAETWQQCVRQLAAELEATTDGPRSGESSWRALAEHGWSTYLLINDTALPMFGVPARTEDASERTPPTAPSERDWSRSEWGVSWRRAVASGERLLALDAPEHVYAVGARIEQIDRRTGQSRWTRPVDRPCPWLVANARHVVWSDGVALTGADAQTGARQWWQPLGGRERRGSPQRKSTSPNDASPATAWQVLDDSLLFSGRAEGLATWDCTSGLLTWRYRAPIASTELRAREDGAVWALVRTAPPEFAQVPIGAGTNRRAPARAVPELASASQVSRLDPRVWFSSREAQRVFVEGSSDGHWIHRIPLFLRDGDQVLVLREGMWLEPLGSPVGTPSPWRTFLTRTPLDEPERQTAQSAGQVFVATSKGTVAVEAASGRVRWTRPSDVAEESLQVAARSGILARLARRSDRAGHSSRWSLSILSAETGQLLFEFVEVLPRDSHCRLSLSEAGVLLESPQALVAVDPLSA